MVILTLTGLSFFGLDRMYAGQIGMGVLKLITAGGFGLWFIVVIGAVFYVRFISENNIVKKVLSDDLDVKGVVDIVRGAV